MNIYFVRHGSTDAFDKNVCQSADEELNKNGERQARDLAKRFSAVKMDLVISSPFKRAVQTAQEISKEFLISDLFKEVLKPSEVVGRSKSDLEVKETLSQIKKMYLIDPNWHFSDEENFTDLKKRGMAALEFLKEQNKENILVVSHGDFISVLLGTMMFREGFPVEVYLKLRYFFKLYNTGVSICTYEPAKDYWNLICWNDTSHLLE